MDKQELQVIKERVEVVGELGGWSAEHDEDIDFILHAVNDVNTLIAEIERLRAALKKVENESFGDGTYLEIAKIAREALEGMTHE